ncbi:hypothetical protein MNBD_DELTA03-370 [hydrothermal vent metagenome]|uniref:HipA-like C-terminal domain-containing protein n=1 Tax=hydrothermal vent metagenome TaxID=652676 RepID=A0A3B0V9T3_9ZZZZ
MEDPTVTSYSALANIIQTHSYQPDKDLHQLFRQMVVNVILNNADGHLQNFSMLHTKKGWQLSPAYDIVPNIFQTNQLLAVNQKNAGINVSDLVAEGRNFGLSPITCRQAILDVIEKTSNWQDVFEKSGVPPTKEVKALCEYIKTTWGRIGTVETAKQKNTQGTNVKCQG